MKTSIDDIHHDIDQACSIVSQLVEGGLDPFSSRKAEMTMGALVVAQAALEEAEAYWSGTKKVPRKKPRRRGVGQ